MHIISVFKLSNPNSKIVKAQCTTKASFIIINRYITDARYNEFYDFSNATDGDAIVRVI
jgi:hypothetical protein